MSYRQGIVGDTFYWRALYIQTRKHILDVSNITLSHKHRCQSQVQGFDPQHNMTQNPDPT